MNDQKKIDFTVDISNLYREEAVTDLKVASIKRLVPIKPDGTEDDSRKAIFVGQTQLMTPQGPVPVQSALTAASLEEAIEKFPVEMKQALDEMVENARKVYDQQQLMQKQKESRIIVPGR
ncbi:MAG: cytoplasmic protein [Desulfobacterales bacterium]|nr:cytoplasmic protein [Desulfobacterales bacterium]MDD4073708.1 cytoplasmic protein [Desulfobacterales bacterium]MDD4393843.1 cytoplasmic protein [Desulfobacterales bacterium]